jgi:septal ring factor EnvC (AmiA/AmiB activator)
MTPWWVSLLLWLIDKARLKLDPQYQKDVEAFEARVAEYERQKTQKLQEIAQLEQTLTELSAHEAELKERQAALEQSLQENQRQLAEMDVRPLPGPISDPDLLRERL